MFLIGYHMLEGKQSSMHSPSDKEKESSKKAALSIAISPLTVPILAGPGTIATAMNYSSHGGLEKIGITIVAAAVICIINYVFFVSGEKLVKYAGEGAMQVITRMMGLILAVIGTQMIIEGIYGAVRMFS